MIISSPLFFVPATLLLIMAVYAVPPAIVYAQQPSNTNNVTAIINSTAAGGIQDMRALSLSLEPYIQAHNLTGTFNKVVLAFAYIQGNITALQNQTNNVTITIDDNGSSVTVPDFQTTPTTTPAPSSTPSSSSSSSSSSPTTNPGPRTDVVEEATTSSSSSTEESESEEESSSSSSSSDSNNEEEETETEEPDGPRLDEEGDGGFPGDIDG
jgi:hypothetical protein